MAPQTIYVHTETGFARRTLTGIEAPSLSALHRTRLGINLAFVIDGVVSALPEGVTARFVAKAKGAHTSEAKLLDTAADVIGSGSETRYVFEMLCDSEQLQEALDGNEAITLRCQVEWQMPGEDDPRLSYPFDLHVIHAYSRGEGDAVPNPVLDAWEAGLTARAIRFDLAQELSPEQQAQAQANLGITGGGVTDHGDLTGLENDDHTQYLNNTRGDARYVLGTDVATASTALKVAKRDADGALSAANFRATGTGFESVFRNNSLQFIDLTTQFSLTIQPPSEITEEIFLDLPNISGTLLTHNSNLDANKLVGTIAPARLGTGIPSSSTYLRGDGVWSEVTGGVISVSGTANQIVVTGTTTPTLALASTITGLTSVTSTTFVGALTGTASGNLVAGGALGTPSSGALTNCTSIPAAQLTGTINTARLPATITGLTSVTSTAFVGALTGTASGNLPLTGGTLTGALTLPNAIVTGLSLTGSQATNTLDLSTTWNTTGNPALIYGRVTRTAVGASARLIDLGITSSLFSVDQYGTITADSASLLGAFIVSDRLAIRSASVLAWTNGNANGAVTLSLLQAAAATLQMGANHATTATAQTIKAHNVTTGTGASLEIAGGTGSVARGAVRLNGGNRSAYIASPSATEIRDILISHGLMAAS